MYRCSMYNSRCDSSLVMGVVQPIGDYCEATG
jgi:hypothetical protein